MNRKVIDKFHSQYIPVTGRPSVSDAKGTFGEDSDPENDLIRRQALQALAARDQPAKEE